MLAYQMTRITRDRGALSHDDRLDVLAMAVKYWVDQMAADADREIIDRRDQLMRDELDRFINGYNTQGSRKSLTWM